MRIWQCHKLRAQSCPLPHPALVQPCQKHETLYSARGDQNASEGKGDFHLCTSSISLLLYNGSPWPHSGDFARTSLEETKGAERFEKEGIGPISARSTHPSYSLPGPCSAPTPPHSTLLLLLLYLLQWEFGGPTTVGECCCFL